MTTNDQPSEALAQRIRRIEDGVLSAPVLPSREPEPVEGAGEWAVAAGGDAAAADVPRRRDDRPRLPRLQSTARDPDAAADPRWGGSSEHTADPGQRSTRHAVPLLGRRHQRAPTGS